MAKAVFETSLGITLHAPDGAIMLAASAVDSMLKLKGYSEGSVYSRINLALKDNILTSDMAEWAHAVRLEGNKPRHADVEDPHTSRQDAAQAIDFAETLGEILFILPERIRRGKEQSEHYVSTPDSEGS